MRRLCVDGVRDIYNVYSGRVKAALSQEKKLGNEVAGWRCKCGSVQTVRVRPANTLLFCAKFTAPLMAKILKLYFEECWENELHYRSL